MASFLLHQRQKIQETFAGHTKTTLQSFGFSWLNFEVSPNGQQWCVVLFEDKSNQRSYTPNMKNHNALFFVYLKLHDKDADGTNQVGMSNPFWLKGDRYLTSPPPQWVWFLVCLMPTRRQSKLGNLAGGGLNDLTTEEALHRDDKSYGIQGIAWPSKVRVQRILRTWCCLKMFEGDFKWLKGSMYAFCRRLWEAQVFSVSGWDWMR